MAIQKITSGVIQDNAVVAADIADGTITSAKLAANTLANSVFQTGSVENYMNAAGLGFGMRNRIINGAMVIDQRNAGASVTNSSSGTPTYILDRWGTVASQASKFTIQQNAGSITPPAGFINYLGVTSSSAYSRLSTDYFGIVQPIEGLNISDLNWGSANANTVTLSFWVRSSLTGTFAGRLTNSASNRSYVFTYTISSANTWEYETITIAGDISGTWLTTNGVGISAWFDLGTGTTFQTTAGVWTAGNYAATSSSVSVVGTNGATFYLTGVQLEKGSTATSFDYRPYGTELALCMRYCVNYNSANASSTYLRYGIGEIETSTNGSQILQFLVPMRTGPTLTTTGTAANYAVYSAGSVSTCTVVPSIGTSSTLTAQITWATTGLTLGRACSLLSNNNNTSYLILSAEL